MKKMLALAAAGDAAPGLVLLVYLPIVVRLLFNAQIAEAGMVMSLVAGSRPPRGRSDTFDSGIKKR